MVDAYGAPVSGATVTLNATSSPAFTTNAEGVALVAGPPGAATLAISVPSFVPGVVQTTLGNEGVASIPVTLQRVTEPAGGSLGTRSGVRPLRSDDGRRLSFEVELVVVGADAQTLPGSFHSRNEAVRPKLAYRRAGVRTLLCHQEPSNPGASRASSGHRPDISERIRDARCITIDNFGNTSGERYVDHLDQQRPGHHPQTDTR